MEIRDGCKKVYNIDTWLGSLPVARMATDLLIEN